MAAKNASLASSYADRRVFLVDKMKAQFSVRTILKVPTVLQERVFIIEAGPFGGGGGGGGVTYRMRGYDGDLSRYVYWNSSSVDSAGADYPGNSGALTDVVVQNVIGQV
jgi:hypothetical protein